MKCRAQVGLALAGGYLLGRTKKMKLALMVAGFTAGRGLPTRPSELLKHGSDAVRSSPELTKLVDFARGSLFDAGKAAAVAAASSRMESVSDRLSERATSLGTPGIRRRGDDNGAVEEDSYEDEPGADEEDDVDDVQPAARSRSTTQTARRTARDGARSTATKRAPSRRRTTERARAASRRGEDDG